jgi:DMSO reductase family type II enzyme chaperone
MNPNIDSTAVLPEPLVRSHIYHLFALGFKYPTREAFDTFQSGQFLAELLSHIAALPHLASLAREEAGIAGKVSGDLEGIAFEDFETTYVGTFDVGFPEPPCPPYEGVYSEAMPRTEIMLEVGRFYTHFGLAMNQTEGKRELPDYLCAELEFLHFLAIKEAQASEAGNGSAQELFHGYVLAQKDFLERHMIAWLPKFSEKVQGVNGLAFYPDLARVLVRLVNEEFARLRAAVP